MNLAAEDGEVEWIAISALQHWSYCPRQCALIHLEQAWDDNVHTLRGDAVHATVDVPGSTVDGSTRCERALPLWSRRLGLSGRADIVEFRADGMPYPIEYKHGHRRPAEHDELQLAAQALCLEEMTGLAVPLGAIYHHGSRRRREVAIDAALRARTEAAVAAVRELLMSGHLPPPSFDARCEACSLRDLCQPEAVSACEQQARTRAELFDPDAD
ncbi:CRISPR-associated protein Cas4 [Plasticicumulans acidivorans]|uniref:CRISPR-associated exonuclease Cas4 n=1 Tax=Plasticicumulans acidivorans TaxID=886464 RepID=A0A317MWF4_9GAMM|nr:CRISPR-associated protein Cas4 [Plasticicumulans acidivorans]PWV62413.1 CRISPR-associated Cas4 family exonuclease [Plasticicumulans acidivorans]